MARSIKTKKKIKTGLFFCGKKNCRLLCSPYRCLTSPKLPKAPDQPPLALSFASWLAADKPVIATVEMFDGNFWFPLTEVTSDPQDPNWDLLAVDLPRPVDAPVVQVRFCLAQPEPMMGMFGGWSIDDVVIGPIACAP